VATLATQAEEIAGSVVPTMAGAKCPECGAHAMIRKDGCDFCTQCGHVGACG
jgi:ribonucleoside-diphosphate reductase alpha chain